LSHRLPLCDGTFPLESAVVLRDLRVGVGVAADETNCVGYPACDIGFDALTARFADRNGVEGIVRGEQIRCQDVLFGKVEIGQGRRDLAFEELGLEPRLELLARLRWIRLAGDRSPVVRAKGLHPVPIDP